MARQNIDISTPEYQASITADGGTDEPRVDELGDESRSATQRPDYPESEAVVHGQLDSDLGSWATNDSTIDDDAMGPVNVPWPTPDYAPPEVNEPDDGWGPEAGHQEEVLPPGSFRGAVHMSDPQCKPMGQSLLGQEDFA